MKSVSDIQTIITKQTNRETKKRDIQLVDQSMMQVRITLWGADVSTSVPNLNITNVLA